MRAFFDKSVIPPVHLILSDWEDMRAVRVALAYACHNKSNAGLSKEEHERVEAIINELQRLVEEFAKLTPSR